MCEGEEAENRENVVVADDDDEKSPDDEKARGSRNEKSAKPTPRFVMVIKAV